MGKPDRLMVATIGRYAHDRIRFAIAERPVQKMVLMHSDDTLSHEAARKIQSEYGSKMVNLIKVDPWNYESLLVTALKIPSEYPNYTPEFHIGLGTRVMTMALSMAALFLGFDMYMVVEDEEKTMRAIKQVSPFPTHPLSRQKKLILQILNDNLEGFSSIKELARAIRHFKNDNINNEIRNCEISNYRKHVQALEEWEFVTTKRKGRGRSIKITPIGIAVLSLKQFNRPIWSDSR